MKSFFWKFVICVIPVLLAGWITADAVAKYKNGEPSFKLGVDLAGGTILVYEIDFRKTAAEGTETKGKSDAFDPVRDINVLAESLKRRIDPNDLYNIVIRPAGGEGRIEIILPTGGVYRSKKSEEAWKNLVDELQKWVKTNYGVEMKEEQMQVPRGRVLDLAQKIQRELSIQRWKAELFSKQDNWNSLLSDALKRWAELDLQPGTSEEMKKLPVGELEKFKEFIVDKLADSKEEQVTPGDVDSWVNKEAWKLLLNEVEKKWPNLAQFHEDLERIQPDSIEQLIGFVQAKGSMIGQAGAAVLDKIIGVNPLEKADDKFPDEKQVRDFISEKYGPSLVRITKEIDELNAQSGRSRDLSVEEVQRIKDLVSKVGSLQFRILANSKDDARAIERAKDLINSASSNPTIQKELESDAIKGLPPPGPRLGPNEPERFTIKLPRGFESIVTYSWKELGPPERRQLNLDNAARSDATRSAMWNEAQKYVALGQAFQLKDPSVTTTEHLMLQGALFYGRKCEDRNLPEEQRREKEFEYFVLTRDPEFDPNDPTHEMRTPEIDGSYLASAAAGQGQDFRPAVHFSFNNAGADLFGTLTRKNVPEGTGAESTQIRRHLAIVLDGLIMSAPTINSEIRDRGQISGSFTQKEVDNLVNVLRAGRLPATLKPQPVSEHTMSPGLGQDTIVHGVIAIGVAFLAVIIFMVIYYRFAGFVASVALLANLVLTVGFMVAVQATFTLPGLAGIVLMLGMAVDANILIYERLREERERGASLAQAIRNGYERTLPTIIDTHLSSIFTAIVLYIVGNDQLKGFGVSLTVGLIISLFTSLFMTRLMFDYWLYRGWLHKLSMLRLFARPDIDFMALRNVMFVITISLAIVGIALFIGRLPNDLDIDFVGGTAYGGKLVRPLSVDELRAYVGEQNQKDRLNVTAKEEEGSNGTRFVLTYTDKGGKSETRTVGLANKPEGDTPLERAKVVARRASELPDPSVEQFFTGDEKDNRAELFTIRTSEKETEIVQASIDRLLRDDQGNPLLKKTYVRAEPLTKQEARLKFYASAAPDAPLDYGSPIFLKSIFTHQLMQAFGVNDRANLPVQYEIFGEGQSKDGYVQMVRAKFEGNLTKDQAKKIATALAETETEFEARPQPDRLENFDSQLATETRYRAMWAVLASWGAILLYLWFRFGNWTFGLAAVICLIHDLFITLGAIAVCHFLHGTFIGDILGLEDFKINLPAVAALLTLVGYSVNDTIVVFDRIREVRGKNPDLTAQMINDSVNQTLSRTILASLTTWLVVAVLYVWGGPGVHLFAFVMVVGVIVGTYSSIYIASPLLLYLGEGERSAALAQHPVGRTATIEA